MRERAAGAAADQDGTATVSQGHGKKRQKPMRSFAFGGISARVVL